MVMPIYKPEISALTITPNPVKINHSFLITVSIVDAEVPLYRVSPISGTIRAGQPINLTPHVEVME